MGKIDEKTWVPLGLVGGCFLVCASLGATAVSDHEKVKEHEQKISEQEKVLNRIDKKVTGIMIRLNIELPKDD